MGTWHSSRVVVGPDNGGGHASSASWVGVKRMVMKVRMRMRMRMKMRMAWSCVHIHVAY